MDFAIPIGRLRDLEDVTLIIRPGSAVAVGGGPSGYDELPIPLEEAARLAAPYAEAYDEFLAKVAEALGAAYAPPQSSDITAWLEAHVRAVEALGARWAAAVDAKGPFTVRRRVARLYIPYMGSSLTATYLLYPFEGAVVSADNRGRTMAIGSAVVEWGGVVVYKAGLRTLPGAIVLAQAEPDLAPPLPRIAEAVAELAARVNSLRGTGA
ncbi:MAG: hypothetical protein JZD41_00870 [Thermoproteus sp.]|nr:hypothetical protein [Thermoproteus sp.]